jgi:hypothetical protein
MNRNQQACELAGFLAPMLRGASDTCADSALTPQPSRDEFVDRTQPDIDLAILLELQDLLNGQPNILKPPAGASEPDPEQVKEWLTRLLTQSDHHAVELLWALLAGGADKPHPGVLRLTQVARSGGRWRTLAGRVRSVRTGTSLRGKIAGLWMNVVIGLVVVGAWRLAWPPPAKHPGGVIALALFSIWSLSFVPGWMYIRFLGLRAGALWDEYVLNLHRLAWDTPGRLPRPPTSSQFYAEWFNDGGVLLAHQQNIYRQKFDAYYGKSVSKSGHGEGSPVRIETLFPIFLLTATLAVSWTAVLWNPDFTGSPDSVWDVLKFGFLGAYTFILQMLIRRFFQSDLRPSAYAHAVLRIIVVLIIVTVLYELFPQQDLRTEAVVAFIVGFFPLVGMQALQRTAAAALRVSVPSLNQPYPLNQIDGLTIWYEARLLEVGIEDMQSLATANFVDVILHTRVPVGRLVDWVDQAHLYLHLDRIERGRLEQRSARRKGGDSKKGGQGEAGSIVCGSATASNRAGTRTRTALRQLGIRRATDLLKAFPAEHVDPYATLPHDSPAAAHLRTLQAKGLDTAQVRSIVRVLSCNRLLAPVWNWENRGVLLSQAPATAIRDRHPR